MANERNEQPQNPKKKVDISQPPRWSLGLPPQVGSAPAAAPAPNVAVNPQPAAAQVQERAPAPAVQAQPAAQESSSAPNIKEIKDLIQSNGGRLVQVGPDMLQRNQNELDKAKNDFNEQILKIKNKGKVYSDKLTQARNANNQITLDIYLRRFAEIDSLHQNCLALLQLAEKVGNGANASIKDKEKATELLSTVTEVLKGNEDISTIKTLSNKLANSPSPHWRQASAVLGVIALGLGAVAAMGILTVMTGGIAAGVAAAVGFGFFAMSCKSKSAESQLLDKVENNPEAVVDVSTWTPPTANG